MENELNEIFELCSVYQEQGLRESQAFMEALRECQPYLYGEVSGSLIDCYYSNELLDDCLIYVMGGLQKCQLH